MFTPMSALLTGTSPRGDAVGARHPVLDVVVPVHNEEADLEPCLRRLHAHLSDQMPYPFRITVAENASTDRTVEVASRLAAELPGIEVRGSPNRAGAGRCARPGCAPTHRCWSTWTSTCPPTSPRSSRWSLH
jgi:cellulose synthase/poly-beta-1,6-N-acetylglucosamine synthase-like glycosyltransferase